MNINVLWAHGSCRAFLVPRRSTLGMLLLMWVLVSSAPAFAADYAVVISHTSAVESLSPNNVRDVFLKKRSFGGSVRLFPVNVVGGDAARRTFEERVLHMDRDELNRYWIKSHFQGVSPPTTQGSLQSVKRFIENVDGAIGYLPVGMLDDRLKVLYEF